MSDKLHNRLGGARNLASYVENPVADSTLFIRREKQKGIIMYTPNGCYMSARLMHPGRLPFASGRRLRRQLDFDGANSNLVKTVRYQHLRRRFEIESDHLIESV
jgi:hypothetical protein